MSVHTSTVTTKARPPSGSYPQGAGPRRRQAARLGAAERGAGSGTTVGRATQSTSVRVSWEPRFGGAVPRD